jgi:ATP-dependent Clp protease ATP-binding subunit ClpA
MFVRCIEEARLTIFRAKHEAGRFGALEIAPEHLLLALLSDPALIHGNMKGISEKEMRETIDAHLPRREPNKLPHDLPLSETARRALVLAEGEADTLGHTKIRNQHLLLGLLKLGDGYTAELLAKKGLSAEELRRQLESSSS